MSKTPMLIENEIYVKSYDIDVMGIVSNIVYVRWFEDLRHVFLDKYYPYQKMIAESMSPILMKTEIEYKTPLTIYDRPLGRCWMSDIGKSRWEMTFEILSDKAVHCTGKQWGCFYSVDSKKPVPMPKEIALGYRQEAED